MKILYIIALVSFLALAGAAFAITRHIRKNARLASVPGSGLGDSKALEDRLSDVARGLRPLPSQAGAESAVTAASAGNEAPKPAPEEPSTTPTDDTAGTAMIEDATSEKAKSEDIENSAATTRSEEPASGSAIVSQLPEHP